MNRQPRPDDFQTVDGAMRWPFFETERGDVIGWGVRDPEDFARSVRTYDAHFNQIDPEDPDACKADEVSHGHIIITEWDDDGDPAGYETCPPQTPGALPVTMVIR